MDAVNALPVLSAADIGKVRGVLLLWLWLLLLWWLLLLLLLLFQCCGLIGVLMSCVCV
jgi:hypothetical protein